MAGTKATEFVNQDSKILEFTVSIVSSYVAKNAIDAEDLPSVIADVYECLATLDQITERPEAAKPAVPIKKSITEDYLICLEDGQKFKSLRRHLRSKYDLSPEDYREKWKLPYDYPMVAPSYARQRSALAKKMGLGQNKK